MRPAEAAAGVETLVEDPRWADVDLPRLADRAAAATLVHLGLGPADWEIAVLGCSDARITDLNATFRAKPRPTNVLSWPSEDRAPGTPGAAPAAADPAEPELGDVALAFETCAREAEAAGKSLGDHATHLIVHGILHLLGHDHETEADAARMERLEAEILGKLGLPDPYS